MTVQEIKNYALILSGLSEIPETYVYLYINEALNDLTTRFDEAGKKEVAYLYGIDDVWTDLPDKCISVKRCSKNGIPVTEYLIENGQIKFPTVGEHKIEYIAMQDKVTALTDTPRINELFHEALAYYTAYREITRIFMHEEGNNAMFLLSEYNRKTEQVNAKLRTIKKSRQRIKYAPMI